MNFSYQIFFFIALTFGLAQRVYGQEVIANNGGFLTSSQGSLAFTLGEISTETATAGNGIFTQGFQQNFEDILSILTINEASKFVVFPNPINDFFTIQWSESSLHIVSLKMEDAFGKMVHEVQYDKHPTSPLKLTDLNNFAQGIYFVTINTNHSTNPILFKVIKN